MEKKFIEDDEMPKDLRWVQEPQITCCLESVWSKVSLYAHLFFCLFPGIWGQI